MEWMRRIIGSLIIDGRASQVLAGAFLSAVVLEREGTRACGLASTLREEFHPDHQVPVADAGMLLDRTGRELAGMAFSGSPTEASIGMAAVNALLQLQGKDLSPWMPGEWQVVNAERLLCELGGGRKVALVGHFPFVERLRSRVGTLWVLEKHPHAGDLPAEAASEVVPEADILAMTSMTLVKRTFEGLMRLRKPGATVMILGPGTPLTPLLFEEGVDVLAGSAVLDVDAVVRSVAQGATFRQVRACGSRFVTLSRKRGG